MDGDRRYPSWERTEAEPSLEGDDPDASAEDDSLSKRTANQYTNVYWEKYINRSDLPGGMAETAMGLPGVREVGHKFLNPGVPVIAGFVGFVSGDVFGAYG